jgi:hypothetical protein
MKIMLKQRESLISAYHNYLVNNMLSPGFYVGIPYSATDFYFLADMMLPGEVEPPISARLYDSSGSFLAELQRNSITKNPRHCVFEATPQGFRIVFSPKEVFLDVNTQRFANGYLTRINAKLHDSNGELRIEPSYEGIHVYGEACLTLSAPFDRQKG